MASGPLQKKVANPGCSEIIQDYDDDDDDDGNDDLYPAFPLWTQGGTKKLHDTLQYIDVTDSED